ncbi:MAG: TGS domain-containing protein, partial [Acidaminococcales bacterium]|nr:TGS domain-containing protein [Acidaminococcales bacterium]
MERDKIKIRDCQDPGAALEVEKGLTVLEIAALKNSRLAKRVLAAKANGNNIDLNEKIEQDCVIQFFTDDDDEGLFALRHTAAHIMAQAVKRLFPATKLAIGPAINNGFYYDFDSEHVFTPDDLALIEKEMAAIVKAAYPLRREVMERGAALAMFAQMGETYKLEIINQLAPEERISVYRQGEFTDLCAGPHVPTTGAAKAFKLQSIAGAYWRGDEKNKMLQRIYGTAFAEKGKLDNYLRMLEEAARRDHRKLGRELDLFSLQDEGPGFPFFHPNGIVIRNQIEAISRLFHFEFGYDE